MNRVILILLTVLLASCATSYGKKGLLNLGGMKHEWVSTNELQVKASGNGYTSGQRLNEMQLLWAAEEGMEKGFTHFTLKDKQDKSTVISAAGNGFYIADTGMRALKSEAVFEMSNSAVSDDSYVIAEIINLYSSKYK